MVRYVPIDETNWKAACALRVLPSQVRFVCNFEPPAGEALAAAYVRPGGMAWEPFAICFGDEMVGFTLICEAERADVRWLRFFFIAGEFQGRGLARAALAELPGFVLGRFPGTAEIWLTVHPENGRAMDVYRAAGFRETEQLWSGHPVWILSLSHTPQWDCGCVPR